MILDHPVSAKLMILNKVPFQFFLVLSVCGALHEDAHDWRSIRFKVWNWKWTWLMVFSWRKWLGKALTNGLLLIPCSLLQRSQNRPAAFGATGGQVRRSWAHQISFSHNFSWRVSLARSFWVLLFLEIGPENISKLSRLSLVGLKLLVPCAR